MNTKNIRRLSRTEETVYKTKQQEWGNNGESTATNELNLIPRYKIDKNFPKTVPIPTIQAKRMDETLNDLRKRAKLI